MNINRRLCTAANKIEDKKIILVSGGRRYVYGVAKVYIHK